MVLCVLTYCIDSQSALYSPLSPLKDQVNHCGAGKALCANKFYMFLGSPLGIEIFILFVRSAECIRSTEYDRIRPDPQWIAMLPELLPRGTNRHPPDACGDESSEPNILERSILIEFSLVR